MKTCRRILQVRTDKSINRARSLHATKHVLTVTKHARKRDCVTISRPAATGTTFLSRHVCQKCNFGLHIGRLMRFEGGQLANRHARGKWCR